MILRMIDKSGDVVKIGIIKDKKEMYNATNFINIYNKHSFTRKTLDDFFVLSQTKTVIKIIKQLDGVYYDDSIVKTSRGKYGGTFMCKRLFMYFLTWIDPTLPTQMDLLDEDVYILNRERQWNYKTYIMIDSQTNFVKIGRGGNPQKRESTLQSEKPTIKMLYVCNEDVEQKIHNKFISKRIRGEWFNITSQDINSIINEYGFNRVI